MGVIGDWYRRILADRQLMILLVLLVAGLASLVLFGDMLVPLFASLVIAYLLEEPVRGIQRLGLPRLAAIMVVFALFLTLLFLCFFWLAPILIRQVSQLIQQLPTMLGQAQKTLLRLSELYPNLFSAEHIGDITTVLKTDMGRFAQRVLSFSLTSVLGLFTLLVYLILMPILVFFFLKDKERLLGWVEGFLPAERFLARQVWHEVNLQIGRYIRGKFLEILIVWSASFVTFKLLGLNYAMLLGLSVGLSVLIPYVGAAVVTLPVALVAYFQWGLSRDLAYVAGAYGIIQLIDGNLLATLLLSEAVNLHPVAIIAAILFFGGVWGFWGVFFAIPLATLLNAVLKAWPRGEKSAAGTG
ncbi:MAG: AI-2E family transporter [Deltaproteobacteria bacterium]|nr:AI-2E family transporter [Deltaproteobacteria bacterium]